MCNQGYACHNLILKDKDAKKYMYRVVNYLLLTIKFC